jgi:hypothetical protein
LSFCWIMIFCDLFCEGSDSYVKIKQMRRKWNRTTILKTRAKPNQTKQNNITQNVTFSSISESDDRGEDVIRSSYDNEVFQSQNKMT